MELYFGNTTLPIILFDSETYRNTLTIKLTGRFSNKQKLYLIVFNGKPEMGVVNFWKVRQRWMWLVWKMRQVGVVCLEGKTKIGVACL